MVLIPKINEKKTRENARKLLQEYSPMKRRMSLSDDAYDMTEAIQYSDMPRGPGGTNGQESKTIRLFKHISKQHQFYTLKINQIDKAISQLPSLSQQVLKYSYCMQDRYTFNEIAASLKSYRVNEFGEREEVQYSVKNIERLKNIALIQFAEAYNGGEILEEEYL